MGDTSKPKPDPGAQRAADMNQTFLSIAGYADDSMLFVMRYGAKAEQELSKADLEAFRAATRELVALHYRQDMDAAQRAARAQEVKAELMERIHYVPDLVRDFDQFLASIAAARRAVGK